MNYNYQNRNPFQQSNNSPTRPPQPRNSNIVYPPNKNNRISQISQTKPLDTYKTYQQKMHELGRVRYKNQLAQLEYENKLTQLHTKYTTKTKQSIQKKLKAKNQIAQFIDQQQQQFQQQFEELMDYKYGISKLKNFHYQNQNLNNTYAFCPRCDQIYTQSQQQHSKQCNLNQHIPSTIQSLNRIANSLQRLTSQQANQLQVIIEKMKNKQNVQKQLSDLMPIIKNDEVLGKVANKLQQIISQIK